MPRAEESSSSFPVELELIELYKLFTRLGHRDYQEVRSRQVVCSPCAGAYAYISHWFIALNGSPPKGIFLWDNGGNYLPLVHYIPAGGGPGRFLRKEKDAAIVDKFVRKYLMTGRYRHEPHMGEAEIVVVQQTSPNGMKLLKPLVRRGAEALCHIDE
jgi:hypothetical protein